MCNFREKPAIPSPKARVLFIAVNVTPKQHRVKIQPGICPAPEKGGQKGEILVIS